MKRVRVTQETETGRNQRFHDPDKDKYMSRTEFVERIQGGQYPDYHVRKVHGLNTPVSNPDRSEGNNLD
jgi:hypothetical protein